MVFLHGNQISSYYDPEATEGTSRTGQTWKNLAQHSSVEIDVQDAPVMVKKSGSVDATSNQLGKRKCVVKIMCNPSQSDGKFFLKTYLSSDTSVSLQFFNSAKTFLWRVTGAKVKTITPSGKKYPTHGPVDLTIELWGWTVLYTEAGSSAYNTPPDTFVNWADCTIKIGGSTMTTWWDWSWTVTNDLDIQHDNSGNITAITRGDRELDITITLALVDTGSSYYNASQPSFATTTFEIDLNADTYTFAVAYKGIPITLDRTKLAGIQLKGQPSTLTIV